MARRDNQPVGPLQAALQETTTTATARALEGQKIFSPIAAFLDNHRRQNVGLTPRQLGALAALSNDLANIAQQHFNAYISGAPLTNAPLTLNPAPAPAPLPPSPPPSRPPSGLAQSTYASVTRSPPVKNDVATRQINSDTKIGRLATKLPPPDNRLFVRLPENHLAKSMDAYAIHTSLRFHLGTNGKLLKGVQSIKTGFALLPASIEALPALEAQKEAVAAFFKDCQIERSSRWISYRVTNVPRKVGRLAGSQYSTIPINPEILSSEITESTGLNPVSITETATSAANTNTISSSWFINFSEDSKANLPARLSLFGMIANAQLLTRRTKVVQCNRCWNWHNARSCARQPRCRLCGSTQHTEEDHINRCSSQPPHTCPPRCLHCHGPHPADYEKCLLRPGKAGTRCSKAQQAEIRKISSLELAKAREERQCCMKAPEPSQDQDMAANSHPSPFPFRTATPPPQEPLDSSPVTARAVRFVSPKPQNSFDILMNEQI
jgi:hypothetical protein